MVTALADLRARPDHRSELLSQIPQGNVATELSLADEGRWREVVSPDGLTGWIRGWSLAAAAAGWLGPGARVSVPWLSVGEARVPMGARLRLTGRAPGGPRVPLATATGVRLLASRRDLEPEPLERVEALTVGGRWRDGDPPFDEAAILAGATAVPAARVVRRTALLIGVPYLWGGVSPGGLDCSGLLRLVFSVHGIALPRDAKDQSRALRSWRIPPGARAEVGDIVFFGEGDVVTHVGIFETAHSVLHASGEVRRTSWSRPSVQDRELVDRALHRVRLPWKGERG